MGLKTSLRLNDKNDLWINFGAKLFQAVRNYSIGIRHIRENAGGNQHNNIENVAKYLPIIAEVWDNIGGTPG